MIWTKIAKKFLGDWAAADYNSLQEMIDDSTLFSDRHVTVTGEAVLDTLQTRNWLGNYSFHVKNSCYKDKYIVLEVETVIDYKKTKNKRTEDNLILFEINDFGKLKTIKIFTGREIYGNKR